MPKPGPDDVQISYLFPKSMDARVKKYQHQRELDTKKQAYMHLIEKGLQAAENEESKAPKT